MKQIIKKTAELMINSILFFIPKKTQKAQFMGIVSRTFIHKDNTVEYDTNYDMYWLKSKEQYLYMVKKPYITFSKEKLFNSIQKIACQCYTPKEGDTIIDIGAGIGTETLFFSEKIEENGHIYSIEASKNSHQKLEELCFKNGIQSSENLHLAITNENQTIWIEESDTYQVDAVNTNAKGIAVDGVTLDHFITQKNIKNIDFMKVNIEGSELQMIEGMQETIKITKNIAVSCHDFLHHDTPVIKTKISEFLKANNFEVSYNNTGHEVVDSWIYGRQQ